MNEVRKLFSSNTLYTIFIRYFPFKSSSKHVFPEALQKLHIFTCLTKPYRTNRFFLLVGCSKYYYNFIRAVWLSKDLILSALLHTLVFTSAWRRALLSPKGQDDNRRYKKTHNVVLLLWAGGTEGAPQKRSVRRRWGIGRAKTADMYHRRMQRKRCTTVVVSAVQRWRLCVWRKQERIKSFDQIQSNFLSWDWANLLPTFWTYTTIMSP